MPSSTISARPRFVVKTEQPRAGLAYPLASGNLSSPAGLHRRPWLARLRRALRDERFVLHYQPIVSLATGEICHHEALVRLADEPNGRLLAPGCFLPAAERYALVQEIDRLVISKAVALLCELAERDIHSHPAAEREVRVAINLSALSITDPRMLGHIDTQLCRHNVDPSLLVIEITETAAISSMARAKRFCREVRALGCTVALDDFGAGFGSFHYLKHLPFDYLKIDGNFVEHLTRSPKDQLVVQALAGLARGMGKQTIAEFVRCSQTMELLAEYGVDYAQGYQIGAPTDAARAFALAA